MALPEPIGQSSASAAMDSGNLNLSELTLFMEKQQQMQVERDATWVSQLEAQRQALKEERLALTREMEAKMEARLREHTLQEKAAQAESELWAHRVEALQVRLEKLHDAKLLQDEELFAVEDAIADCGSEGGHDHAVAQMFALSTKMRSDGAFARQLKRKYC